VVAHELAAWIVTVHMLVALVIVSLLLYATFHAFATERSAVTRLPADRRQVWFLALVWTLIAATLAQVVLGTQVRGGVDAALDAGTARDAALAAVGSIDRLHRDSAMAVVALAALALLMATVRARFVPLAARWGYTVVALAVAQVLLGVVMAYVSLAPAAQVAHLVVASLLLGAETVLVLVVRHRWSSAA
jgi:cytochrome c oxidase assembly protein subunit 15